MYQEECLKSLEEVKYQLGDAAGAYRSYSAMLSMKPNLGLKAANFWGVSQGRGDAKVITHDGSLGLVYLPYLPTFNHKNQLN